MSTQASNKVSHYNYSICCGPLILKRQGHLDREITNLSVLVSCLKQPKAASSLKPSAFRSGLSDFKQAIAVKANRLWNLLFGTGNWYNENCARKLIKTFNALPQEAKTNQARKQMLDLYDHLAAISTVEENFVAGLKREALLEQETALFDKILADLLYQVMPDVETVKNLGMQALSYGGKKAGKVALESVGTFFGGPVGKKVVPIIGLEASKIAFFLIQTIAEKYGITLRSTKNNTSDQVARPALPAPVSSRAIVVYKK